MGSGSSNPQWQSGTVVDRLASESPAPCSLANCLPTDSESMTCVKHEQVDYAVNNCWLCLTVLAAGNWCVQAAAHTDRYDRSGCSRRKHPVCRSYVEQQGVGGTKCADCSKDIACHSEWRKGGTVPAEAQVEVADLVC